MNQTSIVSGDRAGTGSPAAIAGLVGCAPGGTVGNCYQFDPGADVAGSIGGGRFAECILAYLRTTQSRVVVALAAATWAAIGSIVRVGSTGPAISVALANGASGPYEDAPLVLTITAGGPLGAAQASVAYDGSTVVETMTLPVEQPAVTRGNVDITNGADLNGLHLDYTAPSSAVLTFTTGSLAGAAAGLKAATATVASIVALTAADLLTAGKAALLANPRRLTFATAGVTASDAPANVAIVGTRLGVAVTETLVLAQTATSVTSAKEYDTITSLTYPAADGTGATIAIGYHDGFASPAEIVTAYNTLAAAASIVQRARAAQGTGANLGKTFLEVYTTSVGASVTSTLDDAASTADTPLGFSSGASNLTATGAAATWTPPNIGATYTFPSGTYVVNETYTHAMVGPSVSIGAAVTAMGVLKANYATKPFGFVAIMQPSADAATCKAMVDACETVRASWQANGAAPIFEQVAVGGPWHTQSATQTTNETNIASNDTALLTAFAGAAANMNSVVPDDVFFPGALHGGSYRRSAVLAWTIKRSTGTLLASDAAEGIVPEASLLGPDGATFGRDENTATSKLGRLDGPGFSALHSTSSGPGAIKFVPGATRAGAASRLRNCGDVSVALEIGRLTFGVTEGWEGKRDPTDPSTGMLLPGARAKKETEIRNVLDPVLLTRDGGPLNVSSYTVAVLDPTSGRYVDNGQTPVKVTFATLGETQDVIVTISAVGVTIENG